MNFLGWNTYKKCVTTIPCIKKVESFDPLPFISVKYYIFFGLNSYRLGDGISYENVSYLINLKKFGGMAERQGFEPWRRFPAYTLSRRAPSTTRPPLHFFLYFTYFCQSCKITETRLFIRPFFSIFETNSLPISAVD